MLDGFPQRILVAVAVVIANRDTSRRYYHWYSSQPEWDYSHGSEALLSSRRGAVEWNDAAPVLIPSDMPGGEAEPQSVSRKSLHSWEGFLEAHLWLPAVPNGPAIGALSLERIVDLNHTCRGSRNWLTRIVHRSTRKRSFQIQNLSTKPRAIPPSYLDSRSLRCGLA
jgi:hypothetical protein